MSLRKKIKSAVEFLGILPVYYWLYDWFRNPIVKIGSILGGLKFYLFNHFVTHFPNRILRLFYLRHIIGITIGEQCFIHMGCFVEGRNITIGNNTVIGKDCYLGGSGGALTIKNNVSITAETYIFCSTHIKDSPIFECINKDVTIEDYAWVGARAMILPGVKIGKGSVLGASSTATKDIPDYCVFAGSPAKEIGRRSANLTYKLKYFPYFQ